MIEQGNLRTIIIVVLVLFAIYIIMKRRAAKIKRRHDERSKFRRSR